MVTLSECGQHCVLQEYGGHVFGTICVIVSAILKAPYRLWGSNDHLCS